MDAVRDVSQPPSSDAHLRFSCCHSPWLSQCFALPKAASSLSGQFLVGKSVWKFLLGAVLKEGLTMWSMRYQQDAQDTEKTQIFYVLVGSRQGGMSGTIKWNPKWVRGCKPPQHSTGSGSESIRVGKPFPADSWAQPFAPSPCLVRGALSLWVTPVWKETSPAQKIKAAVNVWEPFVCPVWGRAQAAPSVPRGVFTQIFTSSSGSNIPWAQLNLEAAAEMCLWVKNSFVCPKLEEDSAQWSSGVCAERSRTGMVAFAFTDTVSWSIWEPLWQHPCAFYFCCL